MANDRQNSTMFRASYVASQMALMPVARVATTAALAANTYTNNAYTGGGSAGRLQGNSNGAIAAQDGVSLAAGDYLLVLFEATAANNGLYVVTQLGSGSTPYILDRAPHAQLPTQLGGAEIVVAKGTVNSGSTWFLPLDAASITMGTTGLNFLRVAAGLVHQVIPFSATPAFSLAESQQITLTASITSWTVPTGVGDMELTINFIQNGMGNWTLSGTPGNVRLAGGSLTLTTTGNKCDTLCLKWNSNLSAWVEKSRSLNA